MSKSFDTLKQARAWAYKQSFEEIMFLIHDKEDDKYVLVNEDRLSYLENLWDLNMNVIETWE